MISILLGSLAILNALSDSVKETILSVMEIDTDTIDENTKLGNISNWDSFNNLMLISRFQEDFNIEFTAAEIEKTQSLKELFGLVESKITEKK